MDRLKKKYEFRKIDFYDIRNRNEIKVLKAMKKLFDKMPSVSLLTEKDLFDIYALSLNKVPPHYIQTGTIVLGGNVTDEMLEDIVLKAYDQVCDKPKD